MSQSGRGVGNIEGGRMTVQKLLDRLAHVANKNKHVVVVAGGMCFPIGVVEDTKENIIFLESQNEK